MGKKGRNIFIKAVLVLFFVDGYSQSVKPEKNIHFENNNALKIKWGKPTHLLKQGKNYQILTF